MNCGTLLMLALLAGGEQNEVRWHADYSRARAEAAEKNRPMLLFFLFKTSPPSDKMSRETFADAKVRATLSRDFVCLKIDGQEEAPRFNSLVAALSIESYPTVVTACPNGRILQTAQGFQPPEAILKILSETRQATKPRDIAWRTDYKAARKEAAEKKRPLLLYFTFAECYHARRLEKTTLRNEQTIDLINKHFVCVKIDVKSHAALAKAFEVYGCPVMVLSRGEGAVDARIVGYHDVAALTKVLAGALGKK